MPLHKYIVFTVSIVQSDVRSLPYVYQQDSSLLDGVSIVFVILICLAEN